MPDWWGRKETYHQYRTSWSSWCRNKKRFERPRTSAPCCWFDRPSRSQRSEQKAVAQKVLESKSWKKSHINSSLKRDISYNWLTWSPITSTCSRSFLSGWTETQTEISTAATGSERPVSLVDRYRWSRAHWCTTVCQRWHPTRAGAAPLCSCVDLVQRSVRDWHQTPATHTD